MGSKILFGAENCKRADILASEALDRIFTPGKTELIANCDSGEVHEESSVQDDTYIDFDADENGVIRSLKELLDPESSYEDKREAAEEIIEEAITEGDEEADASKVDMIADMVLAKIEAHNPEDDEVEVQEETADDTYVPDEEGTVVVIEEGGDYEESPVAIANGSKAEELLAKREALRMQIDQEKTNNQMTLAQKKEALDKQREIIRRQTALKNQQSQYAMMDGGEEEGTDTNSTWIPEENMADVESDSRQDSMTIVEDTETPVEPTFEESCKSEEDVQESCKTETEDVQESCKSEEDVAETLGETGLGGQAPAEDPAT